MVWIWCEGDGVVVCCIEVGFVGIIVFVLFKVLFYVVFEF